APLAGVQAAVQPASPGMAPGMAMSVAPAAPIDPLNEAPEACWYVRPPTGGQYGPAKPNTMRQWIAEGRVTGDSLVWRERWPDWKLANATFPNLGGPGALAAASMGGPAITAATVADDPFAGIGPSSPSAGGDRRSVAARRSDGTGRVVAIAALCIALVVLAA